MLDCFSKCANIWTFLVIFCLCFFLETITFTYLISAIQSIENQFQIPSKMSGTLVSASDIGYVLFVIPLSYFGSRGNRARWIGGGCLLISLACLLIAMPHFIFREASVKDDQGQLAREAILPPWIHDKNLTVAQLLAYPPIKKLPIPPFVKEMLLDKEVQSAKEEESVEGKYEYVDTFGYDYDYGPAPEDAQAAAEALMATSTPDPSDPYDYYEDEPTLRRKRQMPMKMPPMPTPDPAEMEAMKALVEAVLTEEKPISELIEAVRARILNAKPPQLMLALLTRAAGMPFGRCTPPVNRLKQKITALKCEQKQSNEAAYGIVFVGIMLIGLGHSMPWTLGVPLIDDNVKKRSTPLYFAGIFFIRILGPVMGFILGSICVKLYFNFSAPEGMLHMDPRWIGAWWLGFLVIFAALFFPALLLFCFPAGDKVLQDDADDEKEPANGKQSAEYGGAKSEVKNGKQVLHLTDKHQKTDKDADIGQALRNFGAVFLTIIKNPIYMFALIGRFFDTMAFKGLFVFLPKYLETHYGMPQFKANIYLAIMGVVGFAAGVALGSIIMRKLKLEGRKAAAYVGMVSFIGVCLTFVNLGLGCTSINNKVGKLGMENDFNFLTTCNADCNCGPVSMFPVCSQSGEAYFSPCTAGCKNMTIIDKMAFQFNFTECGCIDEGTTVSRELCVDDCGTVLIVYFALSVIGGLIGGTSVIPSILIVLRSVPPQHRSVALGFSGFAISLIGTLPSPIVYGFIVDTACVLWDSTCPGVKGSCSMYDPVDFRWKIFGFQGGLRCFGLIFDVLVWYNASGLKLMDGVDEEEAAQAPSALEANGHDYSTAEKLGSLTNLPAQPT